MLRNFLLISLRNIVKNKGGAYLNLLGLTFGMAACLYIFTYIQYERSYDQYPSDHRIFRIETHSYQTDLLMSSSALTSLNVINQISEEIDYDAIARLIPFSEERTALFRYIKPDGKEQKIHIEKVYYTEPSIFKVFPIKMVEGSTPDPLQKPNTILLSVSMAMKIFKQDWEAGNSLIGREFKSAGTGTFKDSYVIAGIFEDLPPNTHLKYDALVSIASPGSGSANAEFSNAESAYTYVLNPSQNSMIPIGELYGDRFRQKQLFLRPVHEIHLTTEISNEPESGTSTALLIFLAAIGLIILALACTNYINNTVVNSIYRAREIGIRKVLGAKPKQLILTFIGEAFLVNLLAIALCLFLFRFGVQLTLVWTNISYPMPGEVSFLSQILFLTILLFVSTLLSSLYPAFYLSTLNPIASLRSKISIADTKQLAGTSGIIKSLLVFQLSASIVFLSGTYIVYRQLEYMKEHDSKAFEFEITGIFPGSSQASTSFTNTAMVFLNEMKGHELIDQVRFSNLYKGSVKTAQMIELLHHRDRHFDPENNSFNFKVVDHSYWKETDKDFLVGGNFSREFGRDHGHLIINESAALALSYQHADSIMGKSFLTKGGNRKIIGVVKNKTATDPPTVYATGFQYLTYLHFVLDYPGNAGESLDDYIKKVQHLVSTRLPFFSMLDRSYQAQNHLEHAMLGLFMFFSFLAIAISCMGMFGLSFFITQKRTREIGIRKIHGARAANILAILLYDFLKLIMYAAVFSLPIVIFGSNTWLENYPYRINIDPTVVGLPILSVLIICLIVIAKKCWNASTLSPIHSLEVS